MGFAEDMAELESDWDEAPTDRPAGTGGPMMPDGQHQAMVVEATVSQRESDDHWQLYFKFQNRRGVVRKWSDLDHEVGLRVAKQDAAMLGYEGKLPGLEDALSGFVGLVCNIAVKTKPGNERDFTNVYINGCVGKAEDTALFDIDPDLLEQYTANQAQGDGGAPGAQTVPTAGADDDIPF